MDKKTILATMAGVVVTLVTTGVLSWVFGVFEAGSDALTEQQIKDVMEEVMKMPDGRSYAATLYSMDKTLTDVSARVGGLETNVGVLTGAVHALADD
jgi:hypothetical protein